MTGTIASEIARSQRYPSSVPIERSHGPLGSFPGCRQLRRESSDPPFTNEGEIRVASLKFAAMCPGALRYHTKSKERRMFSAAPMHRKERI